MALLLLVIISPHVDKAFDTQNVVTIILIGDHFSPSDSNTLTSKVVTTWWYHLDRVPAWLWEARGLGNLTSTIRMGI